MEWSSAASTRVRYKLPEKKADKNIDNQLDPLPLCRLMYPYRRVFLQLSLVMPLHQTLMVVAFEAFEVIVRLMNGVF